VVLSSICPRSHARRSAGVDGSPSSMSILMLASRPDRPESLVGSAVRTMPAERLNAKVRPSGHNDRASFSEVDAGRLIPPNVIEEEMSGSRPGLALRRCARIPYRSSWTRSGAARADPGWVGAGRCR
jgi:hypothetical protein